MKILFVQPDSKNEIVNAAMHIYNFEPLGLYYLAATVKDDHDVVFLDINNEAVLKGRDSVRIFTETVRAIQPDVIAFSALTSVRTGRIKELAKLSKQINQDVMTIVGGAHASLYPSDFQTNNNIDFVLTNNSIQEFRRVIHLLDICSDINSIKMTKLPWNCCEETTGLKNWPLPYRKLGQKYRGLYRMAIGKPVHAPICQPVASVKTSSGCPFRCKFCCLWQLYPRYETRRIESVVSEIASIPEENIFFADDESLIDSSYMVDMASALIQSGLKKSYIMYARSDSVSKHPLLIERLAEAGLREAWIGIEGATDDKLREYGKQNNTASHEKAIEICRSYGVNVHATALVDYHFTGEDFDYMLDYTKETLQLTSCHFFVLTPFKGTTFCRKLKQKDPERFLTLDSDHFSIRQSVLKPEHMSIEEFHQRYANLQKNFNSKTIPFYLEDQFYQNEHLAEFELLRGKNERLYESILRVHRTYHSDAETIAIAN